MLWWQEAVREREIEERERKLGALMAEKGSLSLKKKTSKVGCTPLSVLLVHPRVLLRTCRNCKEVVIQQSDRPHGCHKRRQMVG